MAPQHPSSTSLDVTVVDDARLVELTRAGSRPAFAEVYRRHRPAAQRVARRFVRACDADDVVSEAFGQLLHQLDQGRGPRSDVRSYLLASVRHEAGRRARRASRGFPTDDESVLDRPAMPREEAGLEEREIVRAALRSLPERWRHVLWLLEVEGRRPREVAADLDVRPNTVSALAYRARTAFRVAYLSQHVARPGSTLPLGCRSARERLVALVRGELVLPERHLVQRHVDGCDACAAVLEELAEVTERIPALLGA